jgi:molybdate transport system substrate-binding protein
MPTSTATRRRRLAALTALAAALTLTVGCGEGQGAGGADERELVVLAASSLTEPFLELAERFEAEQPGVSVTATFESSATVAARLIAGVRTDVVATADEAPMAVLAEDDLLDGAPVEFARNELALVVPPGNPGRIEEVGDLQRADFVMCTLVAPCGRLAADLLDAAGVSNPASSTEEDVKDVLATVVAGETDAGLVYASDLVAAGDDVQGVPLPDELTVPAIDQIAVTARARQRELAAAFVDLVLSPAGQEVLERAGFTVSES